ncbi:alpha/beta hydrolase [Curvibacter sp. CHRR-16]|uniref:RBBP9/YdeN family alpha/beta hydrolase n=1 Tax=Curvibacter sp. CHRR-16 TaxID=2835872 RepID=UPI001BDA5770|nr:alpha/beta hydrolase [Curvibacter sp. CHRR-16]
MDPQRVLLLAGWQNSGPDHWQSRWEVLHGFQRVQQHDWMTPRRGDWMMQLEEAVLASGRDDLLLVAHSLGCVLVAAWASHSQHTHRVAGALLVAPGDVESRPDLAALLPSWLPIERQPLPFTSVLLGSSNDPFCAQERAHALAQNWGSQWVMYGAAGHINSESGLGDWPQGLRYLEQLQQ